MIVETHGITKFKYALVRFKDMDERYAVFAIPSQDHLSAWYMAEDLDIVELSKDATDKERWRLEQLGRILTHMLPVMES